MTMTPDQINAHIKALTAIIWLEGAYNHILWNYGREQDRRSGADIARDNASSAFLAFADLLTADGWQDMGHSKTLGHRNEFWHPTAGRLEFRNVQLSDGKYVILQHAWVGYYPSYRDPITPDTETTYEEAAD